MAALQSSRAVISAAQCERLTVAACTRRSAQVSVEADHSRACPPRPVLPTTNAFVGRSSVFNTRQVGYDGCLFHLGDAHAGARNRDVLVHGKWYRCTASTSSTTARVACAEFCKRVRKADLDGCFRSIGVRCVEDVPRDFRRSAIRAIWNRVRRTCAGLH